MAVRQKVTVSMQPTARRPTSAERRAAQIATISTKQAELKREAAERRAKRACVEVDAGPSAPGGGG
jgi:hypothetical protein